MTARKIKVAAASHLMVQMRRALVDGSETQDIVREFCDAIRYPYFAYGHWQVGSSKSVSYSIDAFPGGWCDHYIAQSYDRHSLANRLIEQSSLPIFWSNVEGAKAYTGIVQRMCVEALDSGFWGGYIIPAHGKNGERYAFTIAPAVKPREPMGPSHEMFPSVISFASYVHVHAMERLSRDRPAQDLPKLTDAEKECLFWLAQGKVAVEIAIITGRRRSTTAFHLNNAKQKLDASSWAHAGHLAMRMGLI